MHSLIFQISSSPIKMSERILPSYLYDCSPFASYIDEEITGQARRRKCIEQLIEELTPTFEIVEDHIMYKGSDKFKEVWQENVKSIASNISVDKETFFADMKKLSDICENTHLQSSLRFYIQDWNGWPGSVADLFEFCEKNLQKEGHIYIGSIIDYKI